MDLRYEVILIDPVLAQKWLDTMATNRPVKGRHVRALARTMKRLLWKMTGEPISFNEKGELHNGQHRLLACVMSGAPFKSLVVWGVDEEARIVMDSGTRRTPKDQLVMQGVDGGLAGRTVQVSSSVLRWANGRIKSTSQIYTTTEILSVGHHYNGRLSEAAVAVKKMKGLGTSVGKTVGLLKFVVGPNNRFDEFVHEVATGENMESGSGSILLRNVLQNNKLTKKPYTPSAIAVMTFKAWNAYSEGKSLSILRCGKEEKFPTISEASTSEKDILAVLGMA